MAIWQDIPQPGDQRNQSQQDLLGNARYLYDIHVTPNTGILPVDHQLTGNSASSDGFHNQVSFLNRAIPTDLVNAVNGQQSNSIAYAKEDGQLASQLYFYNGATNFPISIIQAAGLFDATGAIIGNAFNFSNATHVGPGIYTMNFITPMPNANYMVLLTGEDATITDFISVNSTNKATATFDAVFQIAPIAIDPLTFSVIVLGIF